MNRCIEKIDKEIEQEKGDYGVSVLYKWTYKSKEYYQRNKTRKMFIMKNNTEINTKQDERVLVRGIVKIASEGCIEGIGREIEKERNVKNKIYTKGLTKAKDIINELKTILEAYSR